MESFFQDISIPIADNLCLGYQFADDVTSSRIYSNPNYACDSATIIDSLKLCQSSCHKWGAEHQVVFDGSKEFFMVLSSSISESFGEPFKNLGVTMDPSLSYYKNC